MKRLLSLLLALTITVSLCACQGNFGGVNLNEAIEIPGDGVIDGEIIRQIRDENTIGVFTGASNGLHYEWTIFGSDIEEAAQINLAVELTKTVGGDWKVTLKQPEPFGFSALLSVYLDETWKAQSATCYWQDKAVASVSVTGSKTTILNMTLNGEYSDLVIRPDALLADAYFPEETEPATETAAPDPGNDAYLSKPGENDDRVYGDNDTGEPGKITGHGAQNDGYLSKPEDGDDTVYTDGKDQYLTDPVPEGKPDPVEPEDQKVDTGTAYTCTFSIECSTILNNLDMLDPAKLEMVPSGGVILARTTVTFYEGESVFDVLQRVCREYGIHMEASWTPIYNSAYVEGIHNLYEFDCGALSGWMYKVNGWYPNYGSSRYQLKDGDVVEWRYTCDLGNDVGGGYAVGG